MKPHHHITAATPLDASTHQRLFVRYYIATTVDLLVLGLLSQFWDRIIIDTFAAAVVAALLLQLLLQGTLVIEHRVAGLFAGKSGVLWQFGRFFSAWLILFLSKFVMLWLIGLVLGERIQFHGALHGAVAFIITVVVMVVAEEGVYRIYRALGASVAR